MANLIYGTDITSDTITREQIIALRTEATVAGDYAQADLCGQALAGDEDSIRACERAIANAAAQNDGATLEDVAAILLPDEAPRARLGLLDPGEREDILTAISLNPSVSAQTIADDILEGRAETD